MKKSKIIQVVPADPSRSLAEALEYLRDILESLSLGSRETNQALLMAEESLVNLVEHGSYEKNTGIRITLRRFLGHITLELAVPGDSFDFGSNLEEEYSFEEVSDETTEVIRGILLRSFEDRLKFRHRHGYNHAILTISQSALASAYPTLCALVFACLIGGLLKAFAPESFYTALNDNLLVPLQTVFMNGLKMCSVPVVFLSIASCIARFGNLSEIRSILLRLLKYFFLTQILAIGIGIAVIGLFKPGIGIRSVASALPVATSAQSISVKDTLVGIMPDNIIRPFLEGNMLQLILLAVMIGLSVGALEAKAVRGLIEEGEGIIMRITASLMRFTPVMVFCSFTSLLLTTGVEMLLSLLQIVLTIITGYLVMAVVYYPLIALLGRVNPARLYSKALPMMLTAFSTVSSSATIPDSMAAAKRCGVSPKVYSLAIPLGATINKNALCLFVTASSLFLCRINGVEVSASAMAFLIFFVLMSVIGAATVPGAGIITLSVILAQLGCPAESVGWMMGIIPIFDMVGTPVSCLGTLSSTFLTASEVHMVNLEEYKN